MYHINPACTKSILRSMPKKEFIGEMEVIRVKLENAKEGTQEYYKFQRLFEWGRGLWGFKCY